MKKNNELSLGQAIREFLEVNDLSDKYLETEIFNRWDELAGRHINVKTRKVVFRNHKLIVFLNSSTLRNELSLRKQEFIEKLNLRLKGAPIRDMEFR